MRHSKPPENILISRTDRLGDVILALPCSLLLKRLFPQSKVSFLVRDYTAPIAQLIPSIDSVISVEDVSNWRDIFTKIKDEDFNAAVLLYPDKHISQAVKRSGIPIRGGIAYRWHSRQFTYKHKEHRKHNLKHEVDYNLSLAFATFCTSGDWQEVLNTDDLFPMSDNIPASVKTRVAELLAGKMPERDKLIAIHPGGGGSAHRWPLDHFCQLAKELNINSGVKLIVTGTSSEEKMCAEVVASGGKSAYNLCNQVSLMELAELYRRCDLLLTNSTGPLHLGRLMGTEVLGLFPNDHAMSPVRWGPYGLQNHVLMPPKGTTMNKLSVASVLNKLNEILEIK